MKLYSLICSSILLKSSNLISALARLLKSPVMIFLYSLEVMAPSRQRIFALYAFLKSSPCLISSVTSSLISKSAPVISNTFLAEVLVKYMSFPSL